MRIKSLLTAAAACVVLAATLATPSRADPINVDEWYTFGFGNTGSTIFGNCGTCTIGAAGVAAPGPWTINLATPMALIVTDGFMSGDEFELFDFGVSIGTTNVVANATAYCGNSERGCLTNPLFSHAVFLLAAGTHSLSGIVTDSPFRSGAAFFIVTAVPEPGTLALLALALTGLGFGRRARR